MKLTGPQKRFMLLSEENDAANATLNRNMRMYEKHLVGSINPLEAKQATQAIKAVKAGTHPEEVPVTGDYSETELKSLKTYLYVIDAINKAAKDKDPKHQKIHLDKAKRWLDGLINQGSGDRGSQERWMKSPDNFRWNKK